MISGKEGALKFLIPSLLKVELQEGVVQVKTQKTNRQSRALHGLYRSLIANAIAGVQKPWQKRLEIVGTGFNVKLEGENLVFKVGYSHPVIFKKVEGIKFQTEGNNLVILSGSDKQLVGQIAQRIKLIKKPDVYKGKGIKYEGERLRIKPGKKTKTADAA